MGKARTKKHTYTSHSIIEIKCYQCKHQWNEGGTNEYYTCPKCGREAKAQSRL